ncbi:hypothetical protein PIB30_090738, partial [Stylosanthes scabra]|nr:hypothetical protein [Stylosanthes scabra]
RPFTPFPHCVVPATLFIFHHHPPPLFIFHHHRPIHIYLRHRLSLSLPPQLSSMNIDHKKILRTLLKVMSCVLSTILAPIKRMKIRSTMRTKLVNPR